MKFVLLNRMETGDQGTFGILKFQDLKFLTGELPWRGNRPDVSCVPPGTYKCVFEWSPKFGRNCYELNGVPGRTEIKFHPANFFGDTKKGLRSDVRGCIGIGTKYDKLFHQKMLLDSRIALAKFEMRMQGAPFLLIIRNPAPKRRPKPEGKPVGILGCLKWIASRLRIRRSKSGIFFRLRIPLGK